jgi:hypothetical protein
MNYSAILQACQKKFEVHEYDQINGDRISRQSLLIAKKYDNTKYLKLNNDDEIVREMAAIFSIKVEFKTIVNKLRRAFRHIGKAGVGIERIKRIVRQNLEIFVNFFTYWSEFNFKQNEAIAKAKNKKKEIIKKQKERKSIENEAITAQNALDFLLRKINNLPPQILNYLQKD